MSAPKKDTKKFPIQLEISVIEELKKMAKEGSALSANALAADWIRQKIKEKTSPRPNDYSPKEKKSPEFDFKELFFQEREASAELRRIIANLSEGRKNFPIAEPAVVVKEGSASTAPSGKRRGGKPDKLTQTFQDIRAAGAARLGIARP